jgi:hypothetical protein
MERYHDNTTPEPREAHGSNDNFKTPDGAGEHQLSISASAYPTPPTDDDEISISCGTQFVNNNSSELFKQIGKSLVRQNHFVRSRKNLICFNLCS